MVINLKYFKTLEIVPERLINSDRVKTKVMDDLPAVVATLHGGASFEVLGYKIKDDITPVPGFFTTKSNNWYYSGYLLLRLHDDYQYRINIPHIVKDSINKLEAIVMNQIKLELNNSGIISLKEIKDKLESQFTN